MLFVADWLDAIFIHFAVEPSELTPLIPLELDCLDGRAYVSLVAFTQRNLRPTVGGALAAWLATPLATHEFLNVRTYVRHGNARGIYFIAEWIPNRLAALIGPWTYGLPYRVGELHYDGFDREVRASDRRLRFRARVIEPRPQPLDDFLLERYTAFTHRKGVVRHFDVAHAPWPQQRVDVDLIDTSLLPLSGDWHSSAQLVAAHHSPGVRDVAISAPRRVCGEFVMGSCRCPTASATTDQ
jgi:uncharacterized protein YqjF (DUF2071 family)